MQHAARPASIRDSAELNGSLDLCSRRSAIGLGGSMVRHGSTVSQFLASGLGARGGARELGEREARSWRLVAGSW